MDDESGEFRPNMVSSRIRRVLVYTAIFEKKYEKFDPKLFDS